MARSVNGSEAYDLSLFEPKQAKVVELMPNKKMEKIEKRRLHIQSVVHTAAALLVSAIVVAILGLTIASRVQLTEMNSQLSQKQAQLNELVGESKRLESELAAGTSAEKIEEYAREHGLQKVEPGQIVYITVNDPTQQTDPEEEPGGFWSSLWETITGFFSGG